MSVTTQKIKDSDRKTSRTLKIIETLSKDYWKQRFALKSNTTKQKLNVTRDYVFRRSAAKKQGGLGVRVTCEFLYIPHPPSSQAKTNWLVVFQQIH